MNEKGVEPNPKGQNNMYKSLSFLGDAPELIDGSNVVRHDKHFGWRALKTLLDWLKCNKIEWFLYFDANILHIKDIDDEGKEFVESQIADRSHTLLCPGGSQADTFILFRANEDGNHIISNDRYRQYAKEYSWVVAMQESGKRRIHVFAVEDDKLCVPDFGVRVKIEARATCDTANIETCRKAAERGDPEAQYRLGLCFFVCRNGLLNDFLEASKWLEKAAHQGHDDAQRQLGIVQLSLGDLYFCGWGAVPVDKQMAVRWYVKAAECGDVEAQYRLGRCHYNGDGVKEDKIKAVEWYRKAAERGYIKAQRDLCACYSIGDGVAQDLDEAERWFCKLMEQGDERAKSRLEQYYNDVKRDDAEAQYRMGLLYWGENCAMENPFLAARWFRKAAEHGHPEAQYQLGECYYEGFNVWGVEVDESEAVKWYLKAAEQGHIAAQRKVCDYGWLNPEARTK